MADVWVGRFNRWLEKYLNAKGGPVLVDLEPSLRLTLGIQSGPEDLYLQSWNTFGQAKGIAAVAAQFSACQLRNPVGSNIVILVTRIAIAGTVATTSLSHLSLGATTTDLANTFTGGRMDRRGNPNSVGILSTGNGASPDLTTIFAFGTFSNSLSLEALGAQALAILPGDAIMVTDGTVNEAFDVGMIWRERALESSELT